MAIPGSSPVDLHSASTIGGQAFWHAGNLTAPASLTGLTTNKLPKVAAGPVLANSNITDTGTLITLGSAVTCSDTTDSTSSTNGSATLSGGLGVAKAINAGTTITAYGGAVTAYSGGSNAYLIADGAVGSNIELQFKRGGNYRWRHVVNGTESTGNAGGNYSLMAYDDAGAFIDTPLSIVRAAGGGLTIARPTTFTAANVVLGHTDPVLTVGTAAGNSPWLVLRSAAAKARNIYYRTGDTNRWTHGVDGVAESGSDAGSGWGLHAYTDAGVYIDSPLTVLRAAGGALTISRPLVATSTSTILGATGNGSTYLYLRAAAGTNREYRIQSGSSIRWSFGADGTAESGSDAGSLFVLRAYTDTGTQIDLPFTIVRAAGGAFTVNRPFYAAASGIAGAFGNNTSTGTEIRINAAAGANKTLSLMTANVLRWAVRSAPDAESGSDAGSPFCISAYTDAGAWIDNPFTITRAAGGLMTLARTTIHAAWTGIHHGQTTQLTSQLLGPKYAALQVVGGSDNENTPGNLALISPHMGSTSIRGPELYFISSRATTAQLGSGTFAALQASDYIGRIWFGGDNGQSRRTSGAMVAAVAAENWTYVSNPGALWFLTTPSGSTVSVTRMSIDAAGQVAVASNAPSTSTTSGAFIVAGGGGFGGAVWAASFNGAGTGLTGTAANLTAGDSQKLGGCALGAFVYVFGQGGNGTVNTYIPEGGIGADAITRSCFFRDNGSNFGCLGLNIAHPWDSNYALQIGSGGYNMDASDLYVRSRYAGTWGTHHKILTTRNFPDAPADGKDYVRRNGAWAQTGAASVTLASEAFTYNGDGTLATYTETFSDASSAVTTYNYSGGLLSTEVRVYAGKTTTTTYSYSSGILTGTTIVTV